MLGWDLSAPIGFAGQQHNHGAQMAKQSQYHNSVAHTQMPHTASQVNAMYNDNADFAAPGVRDNVANPSLFLTNSLRTNVFDTGRTVNNAPIPNWETGYDNITSAQEQRVAAYWWDITHGDSYKMSTPKFMERGQFIVPKTGFTALRFLTPASTKF